MKFLLVNPTAPEWRVEVGRPPRRRTRVFRFSMLSSLYVAAAMPAGVETQILDEDVQPVDFDTDADLVGISFMTYNAPHAYEIADRFREEKGKPVVVGGFHPTFLPEEAIRHADAVCIGEAENNVSRIIEDFRAGRLQPFYRSAPADLAMLPVPNRRLYQKGLYAPLDTIQATRGCPHQCTFCSVTAFFGHRFRTRPVDAVVGELADLGHYVLFMDDNIAVDREYARELFEKMTPLGKRWFSQCSLAIADDPELLRLAHESGCRGLFVGLESLSQGNLEGWRKGMNRSADYAKAIERIHAAGIAVFAGIVFGSDDDTPAIFDRTLAFLAEANVDALQATILTPFPGTPLFDEMECDGRVTDRAWSHYDFRHVVFQPKGMTPAELKAGHDRVLSSFYSRRSIVRRLTRETAYLDAATILRASAVLNLGYRFRLTADGTMTGS
jgi:radical SAM superfamily enzyme YgiQ (UPF0313 family)